MHFRKFVSITILVFTIWSRFQTFAQAQLLRDRTADPSSPFSTALETLQKQIGYTFESVGLLRRAMTHASYSEENNRALSILGASVIETAVSLNSIVKDVDISPKDLNRQISGISNVETSCAVDATRLGLHKVVRVSPKTNSTTPAVVCGAFRALFGAIAVDSRESDVAGRVFWNVHGGKFGGVLQL
ncbi:Ribonuclease III [Bertholletia excelsa]